VPRYRTIATASNRQIRSSRKLFAALAPALVAFSILVHFLQAQEQASQQRGGKLPPQTSAPGVQNGSYYALVIGIDQYRTPLPNLKTAVNDAKAVAQILSRRYGFQVELLLDGDATRSNILNAMSRYRRALRANDNLLIYYAGHGESDPDADKAYWLPADAESQTSSN
jgi:hypothetical protein